MAKVRSILNISGTLSNITFVDSNTYSAHSRAKRGTHTPITLNDAMKKSAAEQGGVNLRAKIIFDAIKEFAPNFKNGRFWSNLISVFRKQHKLGRDYNYRDFAGFEVRADYPSSKHGYFSLGTQDEVAGLDSLIYRLSAGYDYRLTVMRIATDGTLLSAFPTELTTIDVDTSTRIGELHLDFSELPNDSRVLYALKCEKLEAGKPTGLLSGQSVTFL